jgi:SNF2-related domain
MPATIEENITKAFCELAPNGKRIAVYFHVDDTIIRQIKAHIPGSKFSGYTVENPHWTIPLDMESARELRQIFGSGLQLGDAVRSWARQEVRTERTLQSLVIANDAKLKVLPRVAPLICDLIDGKPIPGFPPTHPLGKPRPARPFQRADIAMMARANVLNANAPGVGKSIETIGAIIEGGFFDGPNLICAPVRALENTWRVEIDRWCDVPVFTSEDPIERRHEVTRGIEHYAAHGEPCFVIVNFDMLRLKKYRGKIDPDTGKMEKLADPSLLAYTDYKGNQYVWPNELLRQICSIEWETFTIDEFHMAGLNNPWTMFTLGQQLVKAKRQWRLSGTPMGGKTDNLFPVLRSIEPEKFSNHENWKNKWLDSSITQAKGRQFKVVGNIKEGLEEDFYNAHARHMVRRFKREALPGIPAKTILEIRVGMTDRQKRQYAAFELDAEIEIQNHISSGEPLQVVGTCILAQFTRLKQFANAYCVANDKSEIVPTTDSGKLPYLEEKLNEFGIRKLLPEPNARAIVASESKRMANMVSEWMTAELGVKNDLLTGDTKDAAPIIDHFQNGDDGKPYVIVMTTQTGGTSLNLERTGSIHILDERWNPDNQEQLEDRGDRGTRDTPLIVCYYRTSGTIQQYIAEVCAGKRVTNTNILDTYRRIKAKYGDDL